MVDILAGLEARGDGVEREEDGVAEPVACSRDEGDLN